MATSKSSTESASERSKTSGSKGKESSEMLTFTEIALTKRQLLQRGEESAKLLNSSVYNLAHRSLIQSYQDRVLVTEPHETRLREWLYTMMRAASDMAGELAGFVNEAQGLNLEALAAEEAAQRLEDEQRGF